MKTCPHCAEQVQDAATKCPHCREVIFSSNPGTNSIMSIVVFVVLFYVLYNAFTAFVENETEKEMTKINAQAEREMERLRSSLGR